MDMDEKQTDEQKYKNYLKALILMKISAENDNPRFFKWRLKKEWLSYARDFGLPELPSLSEEEKEARKKDFTDFFLYYIDLCLHDKAYGSTLFGMISLKDATVREKMENELKNTLVIFPEKLGMEELFLPLFQASGEALLKL